MKDTALSSNINGGTESLMRTVVRGGYCIGCGACAAVVGSPIRVQLDEYGRYQASLPNELVVDGTEVDLREICPFSGTSLNEDVLGADLFGAECSRHPQIGYHLGTYAGYVLEGDYRVQGSSGGLGTWIQCELYRTGAIDRVVSVAGRVPSSNDLRLFEYAIAGDLASIRGAAKSRYYPVTLAQVLHRVRETPGRYAVIAVPCFIKALRLLARQDSVVAERIVFYVGLVCGHMKSARFAESIAWQCGIKPGSLRAIDFRKKLPEGNANHYAVEVTGEIAGRKQTVQRKSLELYGGDWGLGFFKYKACDFCDDVLAETADVVVGDAWLPQYVSDSQGTNILVVRHKLVHDLLEDARQKNRIHLEKISPDDVARSQAAGLRHRRDGLAYRLYLADQCGDWRPARRTQARADHLSTKERQRYRLRARIAELSHEAFDAARQAEDFSVLEKMTSRFATIYRKTYASFWKTIRRIVSKLTRWLTPE